MSLTRKQFEILEAMITAPGKMTQRGLADAASCSLGTVNKVLKELSEAGFIESGAVTSAGQAAMEPYRVKRAVFIAAGFGTRLVPITFNTPKPLVRVHGVRIIDRLIDACLAAGINEIYVVRGYLAELFDQLLYKYPMVRFLENPLYNEANNISSALAARFLLSNAYVFEADLLLSNPSIIRPYHYTSNFLGIKKQRSDDWILRVKDGVCTSRGFRIIPIRITSVKDRNNYVPTPIEDDMKIEGIINTLKDNGKKYLEYPVSEYPTEWKE